MVQQKARQPGTVRLDIEGKTFFLHWRTDDIIDALSTAGEEMEKGKDVLILTKKDGFEVWTHKKI